MIAFRMASDLLSPEASSWASARRAAGSRRTLMAVVTVDIVSRCVIHERADGAALSTGWLPGPPMSYEVPLRQVGYGRSRHLIERTHVMSVELNAYLFFPGNTEQAIAFYQQVFGGQVTITRRGDVDPTATSEQEKNQVINALLTGGDITLRASDREDASAGPQTRIELSLIGTDDARLRALFDGLAEGGTVKTKLERQFWGDVFGSVIDKYGIGWQVNIGTAGA
jgi:PhnB protein